MKKSVSLGFLLLLAGAASGAASSPGRGEISYSNYLAGLTVNSRVTAPQASSAELHVTRDVLHSACRGSSCPAAGTPNSLDNPAPRGSVVSTCTGFGPGGKTPETFIGNRPASVLSAGQRSGSPPGTAELRVRIPDTLPPAFQAVASFQFRQGLFIPRTNLFVWIR
jgi:hypothetical protein